MAINFPNNPNPNDTWSEVGKTWLWDGTTWKLNSTTSSGITDGDKGDITVSNSGGTWNIDANTIGTTELSASGTTDLTTYLRGDNTWQPISGLSGLQNVVEDITPQLGGKLDCQIHNIDFYSGGACFGGDSASYGARMFIHHTNGSGGTSFIDDSSANGLYLMYGTSSNGKVVVRNRTGSTQLTINDSGVQPVKILDKDGQVGGSGQILSSTGTGIDWIDVISKVGTITVTDESQDTECYPLFSKDPTGDIAPKTGTNIKFNSASGQLEAGSFKKTGGTSSEFLKADGSIDTTTYLSSVALNDLSNVDAVTNVAQGKILKYNGSDWEVADDNASGGGGGATTINNNADNRIITGSATANTLNAEASLTYDGTKLNLGDDKKITFGSNLRMEMYTDGSVNYIKSATDGSGAFPISIHSGSSEVIKIDDGNTQIKTGLKDYVGDLGNPGQILSSTGTQINWVNASSGALNDLTDVDTAGAANLKILRHNGTEWQVSDEIQSDWNETNANLTAYIKNKPTGILTSVPTLDAVLGAGNTSTTAATVGNFQCANLTVTGTTTTVNSNTVNIGDSNLTLNSDETGTPSQNGGLTIERGTSTNVELRWNETSDKWQYTNDGSTYSDIGSGEVNVQSDWSQTTSSADDFIKNKPGTFTGTTIGLVPDGTSAGSTKFLKSDGSWDTVSVTESDTLSTVTGRGNSTTTTCSFQSTTHSTLTATGLVTAAFLNVKDPKIVLNSDFSGSSPTEDAFLRVERGNSTDVNIKWNESSNKWQATDDGSSYYDLNQTNTNNYASSFSWNSGNGVLTLNRSGLSAITVDLDGRYATGTIPTNNNQLTNGANYVTSSGTITNSEKIRIRTDTDNTMHNLVFVDSYSDNQFQVLKVDNETNSLCFNPSSNRLIGQDFQSFRMTSWGGDYGSSGQFLMSNGSSQWGWSTKIEQSSNGEIRINGPSGSSTNLEGGHLQFEDSSGNTSYAIDVYRNSVGADIVMRFLDQSQGLERFSVGPQGQWGIGHVGGRDFGSLGQVMISRGAGLSPQWGDHSGISGSEIYATNAQGAKADTVDADINDIYAQLVEIGNDDTIISVAQIKEKLRQLART